MFRVFADYMNGTYNPFIDPGSVCYRIQLAEYDFPSFICRYIMRRQTVQTQYDNILLALPAFAEGLILIPSQQKPDKCNDDFLHYIDIFFIHLITSANRLGCFYLYKFTIIDMKIIEIMIKQANVNYG